MLEGLLRRLRLRLGLCCECASLQVCPRSGRGRGSRAWCGAHCMPGRRLSLPRAHAAQHRAGTEPTVQWQMANNEQRHTALCVHAPAPHKATSVSAHPGELASPHSVARPPLPLDCAPRRVSPLRCHLSCATGQPPRWRRSVPPAPVLPSLFAACLSCLPWAASSFVRISNGISTFKVLCRKTPFSEKALESKAQRRRRCAFAASLARAKNSPAMVPAAPRPSATDGIRHRSGAERQTATGRHNAHRGGWKTICSLLTGILFALCRQHLRTMR
jgi:hypothetical protein